jgi:hypothetical protein
MLLVALLWGCGRLGYDPLAIELNGDAGAGSGGALAGSGGADVTMGGAPDAGGSAGSSTSGSAGTLSGGSAGTSGSGGSGGGPTPLPGAPTAAFVLSPTAGDTATVFSADAGSSADAEDATDELTFDWDWESDGSYDDSGSAATHSFAVAGSYVITLRVTDSDGNTGFATEPVTVVDVGDLLVVSTGADENDAESLLQPPLGDGISLREAITLANSAAGKQLITFEPGITSTIDFGLPVISDTTDIYGNGTLVDGSALGGMGPCLRIQSTVGVYNLEVQGCPGAPIIIQGGSDSVVAGCYVHDNGTAIYSLTSSNNIFGPGNEIARSAEAGIYSNSPGDRIVGNQIHDNAAEQILTGGGADGAVISGNLLLGGTASIQLAAANMVVRHNTMIGAGESALNLINVSGVDLRNNVIVSAAQYGILGETADFAEQSHNLFFDNGSGPCSACTPGSGSVEEDPLFVGSGDYRLSTGSPAIDAGLGLGDDVNGAAPGDFSGSAPDLGYYEAP